MQAIPTNSISVISVQTIVLVFQCFNFGIGHDCTPNLFIYLFSKLKCHNTIQTKDAIASGPSSFGQEVWSVSAWSAWQYAYLITDWIGFTVDKGLCDRHSATHDVWWVPKTSRTQYTDTKLVDLFGGAIFEQIRTRKSGNVWKQVLQAQIKVEKVKQKYNYFVYPHSIAGICDVQWNVLLSYCHKSSDVCYKSNLFCIDEAVSLITHVQYTLGK